MLEKFLAAEVLEVRVLDPAIAQSLVGKIVVVAFLAAKAAGVVVTMMRSALS
jgi:hypothetical protein